MRARAGDDRAAVALAAARGLTSATGSVRKVSRTLLGTLLARPRLGVRQIFSCSSPVSIWEDLPKDDAAWEACELQDRLGAGWGVGQTYRTVRNSSAAAAGELGARYGGGSSLGKEADRLLVDPSYMGRVLTW